MKQWPDFDAKGDLPIGIHQASLEEITERFGGGTLQRQMLKNDQELKATLDRIRHFHQQVEKLRQVETSPENYRMSAGGFLEEIDRMSLEVREYLSLHPGEVNHAV